MKKDAENGSKSGFLSKVRAKIGASWEDDVRNLAEKGLVDAGFRAKLRDKLESLGISPVEARSISEEKYTVRRVMNRVGLRLERMGYRPAPEPKKEPEKLPEKRDKPAKQVEHKGSGHLRKIVQHRKVSPKQRFSRQFIANQMQNIAKARYGERDLDERFGEEWAYQIDNSLTAEENVLEMERNVRDYARVEAPQPPSTTATRRKGNGIEWKSSFGTHYLIKSRDDVDRISRELARDSNLESQEFDAHFSKAKNWVPIVKKLYHGSTVPPSIIMREGLKRPYLTTDEDVAKQYGRFVYEIDVEKLPPDQDLGLGYGDYGTPEEGEMSVQTNVPAFAITVLREAGETRSAYLKGNKQRFEEDLQVKRPKHG